MKSILSVLGTVAFLAALTFGQATAATHECSDSPCTKKEECAKGEKKCPQQDECKKADDCPLKK